MDRHKRYMDKVVLIKTTINPETEAEALKAFNKLVLKHGSASKAIKQALLIAGK